MFKKFSIIVCYCVMVSLFAHPVENLDVLKQAIISYHESGEYQQRIAVLAMAARRRLLTVIKTHHHRHHLAMVLDIDDTSLSTYAAEKSLGFGGTPELWRDLLKQGKFAVITPTRQLYLFARQQGVTVFFITGRLEGFRRATQQQLLRAGYLDVELSSIACENISVRSSCHLYMRDGIYSKTSARVYKTAMRRKIETAGFDIILNIGDQKSDLLGGYSRYTIKYPNYRYFIS